MWKWISSIVAVAVGLAGAAETVKDEPGLAKHFEARGLAGTFVLLDEAKNTLHVYNRGRAEKQVAPASTFKIPNALIGLDAKVVKDLDEVIPYGGTKNEFLKEWEQDMNLRDAMKISNVPVFHQLARRIGLERMKEKLTAFDYGNRRIGDDINHRFWLSKPLEISPVGQVRFLAKLAKGELPVSAGSVEQVKSLIRHGEKDGAVIFAKTGWGGRAAPHSGWWVGWVEKGGKVYPFALNVDSLRMEEAKHRIPIALDCLAELGIY